MPYKRKVNDNELGISEGEKSRARTEKLNLDQKNKYECIVHFRLLKFYVQMRAKVTKLHRVIKFKQGYVCRDYIDIKTKNEYQLKLMQRRV